MTDLKLEDRVNKILLDLDSRRQRLQTSRMGLADEAAGLLALYQKLYTASIRVLEQTIHGSVARGSRTHAEYLLQMTEGMHKKLQLTETQVMQQVYSAEVKEALKVRGQDLLRETAVWKRKTRDLESSLRDYESIRGMKQLADSYAEVQREIRKVQADLDRLDE